MLKYVCNKDNNMLQNLRNTTKGIKDWKYETFDEVKSKKAEIMRRLDDIKKTATTI